MIALSKRESCEELSLLLRAIGIVQSPKPTCARLLLSRCSCGTYS